jgi:hypothetical protein
MKRGVRGGVGKRPDSAAAKLRSLEVGDGADQRAWSVSRWERGGRGESCRWVNWAEQAIGLRDKEMKKGRWPQGLGWARREGGKWERFRRVGLNFYDFQNHTQSNKNHAFQIIMHKHLLLLNLFNFFKYLKAKFICNLFNPYKMKSKAPCCLHCFISDGILGVTNHTPLKENLILEIQKDWEM